jgi:hypothetical protein
MVTEFTGNGTLAGALGAATGTLEKANRIATIVVGMFHAMRDIQVNESRKTYGHWRFQA